DDIGAMKTRPVGVRPAPARQPGGPLHVRACQRRDDRRDIQRSQDQRHRRERHDAANSHLYLSVQQLFCVLLSPLNSPEGFVRTLMRLGAAAAFAGGLAFVASCGATPAAAGHLRIAMSYPSSVGAGPLDGRLLLMLSTDGSHEPRFQISDNDRTQQIFGIDVEGLKPGQEATIDRDALGYPVASLSEVPAGEYTVQGLLHVYETFRRSDGHEIKLPPDRGEGQQWTIAPGNLYSAPQRVRIDPAADAVVRVSLDKKTAPLPYLPDTRYIKRIRIQSERLTKFWGRPMYLGAILVLPEGWESHPNARYPLAIFHGHFQREVFPWRETPADAALPAADLKGLAEIGRAHV